MALEIERKFLVKTDEYLIGSKVTEIIQVYLTTSKKLSVRVRIEDFMATISVKSQISNRINKEYEYSIPVDEAKAIMRLDKLPMISKSRYQLEYKGHLWEVDRFHDLNAGLVVAEIELDDESETFDFPKWIGEEVTENKKYLNCNLALHPFSKW